MLTSFNPETSLQPANYPTNDVLPQTKKNTADKPAKPNAEEKPKKLQKQRHIILTGFENQLLDFKEYITPHQDKPENLNLYFAETERALKNLKNLNGYKEKDKIDFTTELNTFYNGLDGHSEQFESIKQHLEKASTSKQQIGLQDKFNIQSNAFKKNKIHLLNCFENSKNKLGRLKLRIEKDNFYGVPNQTQIDSTIYWIRKDVQECTIKQSTEAAFEGAQLRVKKFELLEATLKKTQIKFNDVVNLEENLKLTLEAIPATLKEKQQALSKLSESLETSQKILDQLDVETFSKDFKELADIRDLTSFYKILNDCQHEVNQMPPFKEQLDEINNEFLVHKSVDESESKDDFSTKIKNAVKNISLKINDLNMSTSDNLGDKVFGKLLEEQRQTAITNLQKLRNDIISNYNSYRLKLNKANYHFLIFNRMVNPKAKIVRHYLDTETARSTMREMRKHENSTRKQHQDVYDVYKQKLDAIRESIFSKSTEPLFYNSFSSHTLTSVDDCSRMIVIETPMAPTLSAQIAQLSVDDSVYFNSQAKINCLIGDGQKNDALAEQIQELQTHLKLEKDKIKKAYTVTLKDMCLLAKEEINLMGKALTYIHNTHDNDFRRAYTNKNFLTKKLQENLCAYGEYQEYTFPSENDFLAQPETK